MTLLFELISYFFWTSSALKDPFWFGLRLHVVRPLVHATSPYRTSMANLSLNLYVQTSFQTDYLHLKTLIWIEFSLPTLCMNFVKMFVVFVTAYRFNGSLKTLLIAFSWYTSWISQRHQDFPKILFHNCMYGGLRPKRTGLLANFDISSLTILCDNLHEHAPWRSSNENDIYFHTSEEAAYPQLFCAAVANLLGRSCCLSRFLYATI